MVEHEWRTSIMDEKPLSPAARAGLVVNAAFTILLFYLTAILFMAGFTALALLLLLVTMAAARFGMASFVGRLLQVPVRLIGILGKKLWLPSETAYRVALTPEDAPGLFAISRTLSQRSALVPPESISIEMHTNAWVQLRGYRRGAGRTSLGIGFDLLAGLTVSEVEAVLAHERACAPGAARVQPVVEERPRAAEPGDDGAVGLRCRLPAGRREVRSRRDHHAGVRRPDPPCRAVGSDVFPARRVCGGSRRRRVVRRRRRQVGAGTTRRPGRGRERPPVERAVGPPAAGRSLHGVARERAHRPGSRR